nr:ATP-dependent DNA helicase RecG [Gemmatimonadota bacterium]
MKLETHVRFLPGVGARRAEDLARLGIETVGDLLHHYPRDYFDARSPVPLAALGEGGTLSVAGEVRAVGSRKLSGRRGLVTALLDDGTAAVELVWFNQPWVANQIRTGDRIRVIGLVGRFSGRLQIAPTEFERLEEGEPASSSRILPVYSLTEGISQKMLRGLTKAAIDRLEGVADPLPEGLRSEQGL